MLIIGCDFHTRYQQIAMANDATGELLLERRLDHESGEANTFYRDLAQPVRVGIEATGPIRLASSQARAPAHYVGQPTARSGHGPRALPEEKVVHQERSRRTAGPFAEETGDRRDVFFALRILDFLTIPVTLSPQNRSSTIQYC
ncbi:MAG TPA: hypothetical protein VNU20_09310 [Candidatus Sulfotelmatobacter sp.]|jgi:hypothetical protein|nr:hypothetical protein [Candidatus Sulfotelmatobacter sp.]